MENLTCRCYVTSDKPNLWAVWYAGASQEVQAKHDTAFEYLEAWPIWTEKHYKNLKGKHKGLGEVIIKGSVQWRIFGFQQSGVGKREFTVTHVGSHKDKVYSPANVMDSAHKRMVGIKNDASKAAKCPRPKEA